MSIIKEKRDYIIVEKESGQGSGEGTKKILWIFFLIFFFILVLFPFFGSNWRYAVGNKFSTIFIYIGGISVALGVLVITWGFLMLICTRSFNSIAIMLVGVGLLYVGSFFLNPGGSFSLLAGGEEASKGYN